MTLWSLSTQSGRQVRGEVEKIECVSGSGQRSTAWRKIKEVMKAAGVGKGPQVSPKGLRHGFGVCAVTAGIPLNLVQRWLGHAQLTTTAIYADAVGVEEKKIAQRMWGA